MLLLAGLALGVSLAVVWYFRQALLAPWLRPRLEAVLAQALGAERVAIGAIAGNWLTEVDVGGIEVTGGMRGPLSLHGARLAARFSLPELFRGELAGLRIARLTIAAAELDLRSPAPVGSTASRDAAGIDPRSWEPLLRLLPQGGSVRITRLRVDAPHGTREGPLALDLQPGAGPRELAGTFAGVALHLQLSATAPGGAAPLVARIDAADPGGLLDLFGSGAGVHGGSLHAEVDAHAQPWRLAVRLDLRDLVHGDQRLARSHISARLDAGGLAVERAVVDLPGVLAELHGVNVPSVFGGRANLRDGLAGQFAVRFDDLAPYAALLPTSWQQLSTVRGELRGLVADGRLQLEPSRLAAPGVQLQIERGAFPLVSDDWEGAEGSLRGSLSFDAFAQELPWLGATTASGSIALTVAGSARTPQLVAELDLGACTSARGSLAAAQGTLRFADETIAAESLRVQGVRLAALASEAPTRVELAGSCRLRQGAVEPDSLQLELESALFADLLAPFLADAGVGPPPAGAAILRLTARHEAAGVAVASLEFRTAAASPIQLELDGEGLVPLRWSGTALQALDAGEFVLRARLARAASEAAPPLALRGTLHLGARSTGVQGLALTAGVASLRGDIVAGQGLAALLDPQLDLATTSVRGEFALAAVDLAGLPASWFGDRTVGGTLTGTVRANGPAGQLVPELHLSLTDGSLQAAGMPILTDATLRLDVGPDEATGGAIVLATTLAASLPAEFAPDRAIACTAMVRCDDSGTVLAPTTLRVGRGELGLELVSNLRHADLRALFGGKGAIGAATLAGKLGLRSFSLAQLPEIWRGSALLQGSLEGEIVLDGTLASAATPGIVRSAALRLREGEGKFGNLPRLEHLQGEVELTPAVLTLRSFTGTLGAGRFELQGRLQAKGASFVESWQDAGLELRLAGDDLLLYRADGAKVRASVQVTATGTPQAAAVTGEVMLGRGSKYVRRLSLLPDLSSRGGVTAQAGLRLFEVPPPIGDRITLDIAIQTRRAFEVRTYVVDGEVDVAARLRGTAAAPRLEGNLSMREGTLRFPGANLRVDSGLLTFSASDPQFPKLALSAEGKRMGITVTLAVSGRYDRPQVQLSSVPPLPPEDLLVLLTTGQLPSTLAGRSGAAQARFVGGYLAKEIFETYFGSDSTEKGDSPFDRLTIETGREVSKNGTESVLVEYELQPDFAVQAERDQYEDYNLGLVLRFRFR